MKEHPAWTLLEPDTETKGRTAFPESPPGEHAIELSKAISLKRLADAVEKIAECADGIHPSAFRIVSQP